MEQETQTPHKRRVRYKGKYPRKFEEKYKELNPEKYKDTIEHVISKGNTPAGMHISIMCIWPIICPMYRWPFPINSRERASRVYMAT